MGGAAVTMFTLRSLYELSSGAAHLVSLGRIEPHVAQAIGGIHTRDVLFSMDTYRHILDRHGDTTDDEFLIMPDAVANGEIVFESRREQWATIWYHCPKLGRPYILAIKGEKHGHQIFARTFHRAKARQRRTLWSRGHILRGHR
jgi:hypothetical protein